MTRLAVPEKAAALESLRPLYDAAAAARSPSLSVAFPGHRDPVLRVTWRDASGPVVRLVEPASGAVLPDAGTLSGKGFIFPFHYMLHVGIYNVGYWIVGLAAMVMLAMCVSMGLTARSSASTPAG